MILAQTKVEGEPYQTGHNAWLPWKGQQLLDDYRHARGRLEDQSYGRQLPHVRKETKNLSIAVRVALAMQYPDTGCWWWYKNLCYICQGGNPKFGGNQNMGVSSTCSLCNSRICPRHRLVNARHWNDERLLGGVQTFCLDKDTCFRGQRLMCELARTFSD